ncbi:MFS transporter [Paenarthrobacter nicotinovorans]|uniref:MFS transporter n=1 Tax=Paenarthrobacter nicotinovorans TaxID=29320 RepID=UPI0004AE82FB|nr:MFS transporter [Paenarthrobacter nicotinovorans]
MPRSTPSKSSFVGLAAVFAAFFFAAGAPTPLLSLRQQEWGFSASALTIAFSIYAIGLLVALLIGGTLSDHLGRRPVMLIALSGELLSMIVFIMAPNITWVIIARAAQGLATGLATSAFNAAITEHAPANRKKIAGGLVAASVAGGLGLGALVTGAAVQFTPDANTLIFAILAVIMAAAIAYVSFTAETVAAKPGALRSLVPRLSLPASIRREFGAGLPVHIAGWMFPALFLGLSPALLRLQFGLDGGLVAGFTAFLGPFAAAAAGFYFTRHPARHSTLAGVSLILAGIVVVLIGISAPWLPAIWIGAVFGGVGFGGSFGGQLRLIAPMVEPRQRAGVFAGIYTAAYLAFSIPVVIAGLLVPAWGLVPTLQAYGGTLLVFAALGVVIQAARLRQQPAAEHNPLPVRVGA